MTKKVLAFGSPLLDLLVRVTDDFLTGIPGGKGGMEMVDGAWQDQVMARLAVQPHLAPGGSAGNTLFALARLGVPGAMLGKLGSDANGDYYAGRLRDLGGDDACFIRSADEPTGRCMVLVTPDTERTMRTHLGASVTLAESELAAINFDGYELVHIEGYMLFNAAVTRAVMQRAKAAGCRISLDLSSYEVVRIFRDQLPELLGNYVDIVFANEDEGRSFFGGDAAPEIMLAALKQYCAIAVLKLGKEGALIQDESGTVTRVAAERVEAVDTTGAGDLWQAGFLYGWLHGRDMASCGRYGACLGAEVVQVIGAEIPDHRWDAIRMVLK